jgi:pyrimidine-nucleoside phosphorylase
MNLAPADKKIYALRDSISCVESIPLIASSIMSKKIASGADKIVLDVTVGKGAFMKDIEHAEILSKEMIEIGKLANRETVCVLTNMNEPLGHAVGNNLEVIEAIKFLKGEMPEDLKEIVLELGAYMIKLSGIGEDLEENKKKMLTNIENKKAYNKFVELVQNQGGDITYLENIEKFEKAKLIEPILATNDGYIKEINAQEIGKIACNLGAGRVKKDDKIDYTVGIVLNKKVADKVQKGEILGYIHANNEEKLKEAKDKINNIIKIDNIECKKVPNVFEIIC